MDAVTACISAKGKERVMANKEINETMIGKTISHAKVDGFGIMLVFTNGDAFDYDATDGGYSCYEYTIAEQTERSE